MKIVINIPDEMYDTFKRGVWSSTYDGKKIRDIVMSGTILSEDKDKKNLCDYCATKGCILQTGIIRNRCDFYTADKNIEICRNCEYYMEDNSICYGQKNTPFVNFNGHCSDFKLLEEDN